MTEIRPRNVTVTVMQVCYARPRRCERIETARCHSCGWWGSIPQPGQTLDLFDQPEHTDVDCARRQLDPDHRRTQDHARLVAAGLATPPDPQGQR